jgi:hypothetical protein
MRGINHEPDWKYSIDNGRRLGDRPRTGGGPTESRQSGDYLRPTQDKEDKGTEGSTPRRMLRIVRSSLKSLPGTNSAQTWLPKNSSSLLWTRSQNRTTVGAVTTRQRRLYTDGPVWPCTPCALPVHPPPTTAKASALAGLMSGAVLLRRCDDKRDGLLAIRYMLADVPYVFAA